MSMWLRDTSGVRLPLNESGLLIGRSSACQIVLAKALVSRRHVLILHSEGLTRVVPLGKRPVNVDGVDITRSTLVQDNSVLVIEEERFTFELSEEADPSCGFLLEFGGRRYPITRSGFTVGGSADDALTISGWPPTACTLFIVARAIVVETTIVVVRGARGDGPLRSLGAGATLSLAGRTARIVEALGEARTTLEEAPFPQKVVLEFVPNGAILRVRGAAERVAWLPNRRGDLVALLLQPPSGLAAGEWVPDEVLMRRVWGAASAGRVQLNVLVHRTRLSLTEAGTGRSELDRACAGRWSHAVRDVCGIYDGGHLSAFRGLHPENV